MQSYLSLDNGHTVMMARPSYKLASLDLSEARRPDFLNGSADKNLLKCSGAIFSVFCEIVSRERCEMKRLESE